MTYSEVILLPTYAERIAVLQKSARVGEVTLGPYRYLAEEFYRGNVWRHFRQLIITRDHACDLALRNIPLCDDERWIIHHIESLTVEDFLNYSPRLLDPENVILVSDSTHRRIHYPRAEVYAPIIERKPYDTCPWR